MKKIKNILIRIKKRLEFIKKKKIRIQINSEKQWFGDSEDVCYGGYFINPLLVNKRSIIYSFGIGLDISFELDLISNFKCPIYCFDPTPRSIAFMKNLNNKHIYFSPIGLSGLNKSVKFYLPQNPDEYVSGSEQIFSHLNLEDFINVDMFKLSEIMKKNNHSYIDVLKMDIEGSEYEVIKNICEEKLKINQIVLEFHHWLSPYKIDNTLESIKILNRNGYKIFGISKSGVEISFIKTNFMR